MENTQAKKRHSQKSMHPAISQLWLSLRATRQLCLFVVCDTQLDQDGLERSGILSWVSCHVSASVTLRTRTESCWATRCPGVFPGQPQFHQEKNSKMAGKAKTEKGFVAINRLLVLPTQLRCKKDLWLPKLVIYTRQKTHEQLKKRPVSREGNFGTNG